jgi:hypothetical protein
MISIGLFTVIMTIGISAILAVNNTSKKTQAMRAIIDNMSFVMEDMARSMRLGDYFVCVPAGAPTLGDVWDGTTQRTADAPLNSDCKSISFEPYWDFQPSNYENQVAYYINNGAVWKKSDTETSFLSQDMVPITPAEIYIDENKSGFTVTGSSRADTKQPLITIVLSGTITLPGGGTTDFNMETTVSQRSLDVNTLN